MPWSDTCLPHLTPAGVGCEASIIVDHRNRGPTRNLHAHHKCVDVGPAEVVRQGGGRGFQGSLWAKVNVLMLGGGGGVSLWGKMFMLALRGGVGEKKMGKGGWGEGLPCGTHNM